MQELKNPDTLEKFKDFLIESGVDLIEPKIWEIVRFKVDKDVGIIYHNKFGNITTATPYALEAWDRYSHGQTWFPLSTKRKTWASKKRKLVKRDGSYCFYCAVEFDIAELTLEHLLPLSHGGQNNMHNLVLACSPHNRAAASKSLMQKIKLREELIWKTNTNSTGK